MSAYYTERRLNHNLMYTVDHTFGYRIRNSYAHAQNRLRMPTVPKSEAEILNSLKLPKDVQDNG